jgi:hypothetical protein
VYTTICLPAINDSCKQGNTHIIKFLLLITNIFIKLTFLERFTLDLEKEDENRTHSYAFSFLFTGSNFNINPQPFEIAAILKESLGLELWGTSC